VIDDDTAEDGSTFQSARRKGPIDAIALDEAIEEWFGVLDQRGEFVAEGDFLQRSLRDARLIIPVGKPAGFGEWPRDYPDVFFPLIFDRTPLGIVGYLQAHADILRSTITSDEDEQEDIATALRAIDETLPFWEQMLKLSPKAASPRKPSPKKPSPKKPSPKKPSPKKPSVRRVFADDVEEMQRDLIRHGYEPEHAWTLVDDGIGPYELRNRLKNKPGEAGSLERTHGIHKLSAKKPSARKPSPKKASVRKPSVKEPKLMITDKGAFDELAAIEGAAWADKQRKGGLKLDNSFKLNLRAFQEIVAQGLAGLDIPLAEMNDAAGVIEGAGREAYIVMPDGEIMLDSSGVSKAKTAKAAKVMAVI
jgi:hypothetical protein